MQILFYQTNQFNHFNNRIVSSTYKTNAASSSHARRRMMEVQDEAKETESVRVTISGEAMALARQAKAMERLEQYANANAQETDTGELGEESNETVQLTDEELYEELLNQVNIWGDKSYALRHHFNHQETAEMAEKRAAALTEMQKLEEMQKSEISRLQRDAQKAAEQASMQQEEMNKKSSELIMMLESFEDQDEEEAKAAEGEGNKDNDTSSSGSLMEGEPGAMAAKGEMGILDTMNSMDASSTFRIEASDHSIKAVEAERKNIYRANAAENFDIKEKIESMSYYVSTLANNEDVKASFKDRIKKETDPEAKKKLQAMMEYFEQMDMKNGYRDLKRDREFALQERITARDLRIAHLGDRHFALAEQQKKELQSLFDEDDIMRTQGQAGVASRTEEIAERLQDKLDERDHIDEDSAPEEDIRGKEEKKSEETENTLSEKEQPDEANIWSNSIQGLIMDGRRFAEMKGPLA
ncbi:MAG: hypothetical protein K2N95_08620 [Lachnospiraceae bacterium]|nr:hypothetical protein [Lachnospiraceae bacterium]